MADFLTAWRLSCIIISIQCAGTSHRAAQKCLNNAQILRAGFFQTEECMKFIQARKVKWVLKGLGIVHIPAFLFYLKM